MSALLGTKLEDKKSGILESIADLKKCLHHKRIASSDNAATLNQSVSNQGGSIAYPLNQSQFTSISLSSEKNEEKLSTENTTETNNRRIQDSGCEFSQVCSQEDKRNEFRKSSKKTNNLSVGQETFSQIDWQDSKQEFRKSCKKDQVTTEGEEIFQENRQLHAQLGRIRKENRQKIQELAREYENQILLLKQAHQEELKAIEKRFNGELMSKEEELQAMMLICGNSSARTGREQHGNEEVVASACPNCEQHSKQTLFMKKELEEAHIQLNALAAEKGQQQEDIAFLKEQQLRMKQEYDTINNQLTQLLEKYHKLQEENNSLLSQKQILQAENEYLLKSNEEIKEENAKMTKEVQNSKRMHLEILREKQKDLEDLGQKYSKEIECERNKFQDILAREKEQNISKMEILVKDNTLLADQITKKNGIQKDITLKEGQGATFSAKNQLDTIKSGFFSNQNSLASQVDTQKEKKVNSIRLDSPFGNINSNEGSLKAPSQDRALKNLLNKISNFIEKKDTSTEGRTQQDSSGQSSLNNHYNKKLRVLRQENDASLNTSQVASLPKSVNSTSHHLIDCYSSCSSTLSSNYLGQARPASVEIDFGSKSNKYSSFGRESVSFFPHCKSNALIDNIPKRSQSTHNSDHSSDYPLKMFGQDFYNSNHSKSVFNEISMKNETISIASKVENQKQRVDENVKLSRKNYHLNHNYLDSTPKYCFDNKQSHIINQEKCNQPDKENDALQINRPTVSKIDQKIRQHYLQTTDKWEKMDSLKVENEDQDGFMSTIKDLYSKIKLTSK